MGLNPFTDIKQNRILKTSMESYDNKRRKLRKIHFFINLRKNNNVSMSHICVIKQNFENIVKIFGKSPKRVTYSLTNNISRTYLQFYV